MDLILLIILEPPGKVRVNIGNPVLGGSPGLNGFERFRGVSAQRAGAEGVAGHAGAALEAVDAVGVVLVDGDVGCGSLTHCGVGRVAAEDGSNLKN